MKIQLLSDTHNQEYYTISDEADVVIHAGDFGNASLSAIKLFESKCKEKNKNFVFVLGNHDYYGQDIKNTIDTIEQLYPNNFLKVGKEIKVDGFTIIGDTLWTNFRANTTQYADPVLFDTTKRNAFEYIRDFTTIKLNNRLVVPEDYITLFNMQYHWINQYRGRDDVIVVTHFPMHIACLDPYWGSHPKASMLNPYFINDLDVKGFKLICSGHTHSDVDTVVNDCRLVINPFGYPFENNDLTGKYTKDKIIEI